MQHHVNRRRESVPLGQKETSWRRKKQDNNINTFAFFITKGSTQLSRYTSLVSSRD